MVQKLAEMIRTLTIIYKSGLCNTFFFLKVKIS